MIRRIQVYGQRCSGTNALIRLIESNFPDLALTEAYGFKHWLVPPETRLPDDVMVVVIARETGEWLHSLHRNPWHCTAALKALPFSEFIRAPWMTIWDEHFWGITAQHRLFGTPIAQERCPRTGEPFANALAMRTAKLDNWTGVARRAAARLLTTTDRLSSDPERLLARIAEHAGSPARMDLSVLETYKGERNHRFVVRDYPELSRADRRFVEEWTDPETEARFGFASLEPVA